MKKYTFLDNEEKNIIEAFEKGEFKSTSNLKDRKEELNKSFKKTIKSRNFY